ncbi:hypothetical protein MPTK1_6g01240 [Marchantia polymorpha subsp. ruderalis]|uniref:Uncharacterized protein n=2 Tax=Marchantia polymorpha TaxID=3197 RepID=A0AAF6BMB8_MARPO|nr:hypothetical protein MARPO_0052s0080 [Marchantia polymorpha]BBN13152.1 hypothetical protein Mp_6g01240 [Marchantia polymorpha subsp. ruderalis]|eukprot:PTQ38296.1 hypothetical protein MARPO_0052s0080 [Marchantia polymorpha]
MDSCCSGCGMQHSLYGEKLQEIALHCSYCGVAVKQWSCYRHSCEVLIWTEARHYVCLKCKRSEFRLACENNISMLALSLSLELYYKCKRRLISDEEEYMLIELWSKARVSGIEFARAAAKEAAAAACRASETASFIWSSSDRIETAARNMMADLARSKARSRARASVPGMPPNAAGRGLTHRRPSKVQEPLKAQKESACGNSRLAPMIDPKGSTGFRQTNSEQASRSIKNHNSRRRRAKKSSQPFLPLFWGCRCQ